MDKQQNKDIILALKNQRLFRAVNIDKENVKEDDRTIRFSFSSETPIMHSLPRLGNQPVYIILGHKDSEVNLSKLNKGKNPILLEHLAQAQVGVIDGAQVGNGIGQAWGRISRSALGNDTWADISDGIKSQISVGTTLQQLSRVDDIDGVPTYRATQWTPFECSIVSLAADESAGIYRSEDISLDNITESTKEIILENSKEEELQKMDNNELKNTPDITVVRDETLKSEQERVSNILAVGERHGEMDLAKEAIRRGTPVQDFNAQVLERLAVKQPQAINPVSAEIGMSKNEVKKYSIARAVKAMVTGDWKDAGLEREASFTAIKLYNKQPTKDSIMLPYDIITRDVDFTTEGADLVGTNFLKGSLIDLLQSKLVTRSLGVDFMDLPGGGPIDIPRISAGNTFAMFATENAGVNEGTPTFDRVQLTPHTGSAWCEVSERLLMQSLGFAEMIIMKNLSDTIARGIDSQIINGAHTSGETDSVIHSAGNTVSSSTGSLDYSDLLLFESMCAADNFNENRVAYLTTPTIRGYLKGKFTNATYGEVPLWMNGSASGEGMVNGYRAVASTICPTGYCIFGNWQTVVCAMFGGVILKVNPYAKMTTRLTQLCAFVDFDVALKQPNEMSIAAGITS